jgi:peptidase M28-like protein/PDZ domain-containing protein
MKKKVIITGVLGLMMMGTTQHVLSQNIEAIKKDVTYLASDELEGRNTGTEGEKKAAAYIITRYEEEKLLPKGTNGYLQVFSVKPKYNEHSKVHADTSKYIEGHNVIGFMDNHAKTTVVIGAHYDHLGWGDEGSLSEKDSAIHNGADDNASGVALVLQLADMLRNKYTNNNYLFMCFSGEEKGLWGSNWYTKHATIDMGTINYMINMDMVGRMNDEKTLVVYGTGTSPVWNELVEKLAKDNVKLVTKEGGIGPSDHTSFYLKDIPVLHFFTGQHEDYHKPSDDVDKINFEGMITVAKFVEGVIADMDDNGKLAFTKTKDEESTKAPKYSVTLGVIPDYLYDGKGMKLDGVKDDKPAKIAGMQAEDIVIKMGDIEINTMMDYMKSLGTFKKGDKTTVIVKRGEETLKMKVTF